MGNGWKPHAVEIDHMYPIRELTMRGFAVSSGTMCKKMVTLACCGQALFLQNMYSIKTFQAGAVDPENELAAAIMNFSIRPATKADCKDIWRMIRDLAIHEKMLDQMIISYEDLERDAFGQNPWCETLVAEVPGENKSKEGFQAVGFALYLYKYSTWKGRTVYLEDLYVMPEFRGFGIGKNLLRTVAKVATEKQCAYLELSVLGQNITSRSFYAANGAEDITVMDDWHYLRFGTQSLTNCISC